MSSFLVLCLLSSVCSGFFKTDQDSGLACRTQDVYQEPHDHVHSVKMSRPRRCGWWCRVGLILTLYIIGVFFPGAPIFVQGTIPSTSFSYPVFRSLDDFLTFGEPQHRPESLSVTVNPIPDGLLKKRSLCVKLLYKDMVRMKSRESSAVASFRTSFTLSITKSQEEFTNRNGWLGHAFGFMFNFVSLNVSTMISGWDSGSKRAGVKYFAVEFDTHKDSVDDDPSDNCIGVNINSVVQTYTYNLCGVEQTNCSFPGTSQPHTAWIDYNGSTRSLEIWFAQGSLAYGVVKPAGSGLIKVPELDLIDSFDDYMYVGFSVNVGWSLDTHDLISWNFASYFDEVPTPPPSWRIAKRNTVLIAVCSTTVSVASVFLLGYYWKRYLIAITFVRYYLNQLEPELGLELLMGLRRFSFKELKKATGNFSESALLGQGGSGSVYKGTLRPSGTVVAVKRLNHDSELAPQEFLAEISSISQIRHRNLVHLQGWCYEYRHFLLVFDYMGNGSLDEWLFPTRRRHPSDPKYKTFEVLPWELRFSILAGVAAAVEYLHEEWVQCVLHRDIKSSNVMLDADFNPHLGDFGLARLMDHKKSAKTTTTAGTFGYMAPEMHYTGKATKESDVYSFGILMLEVLCGRKPVNLQVEVPDEDFMLVQNVWRAHEAGDILAAVHPGLLQLNNSMNLSPSSNSSLPVITSKVVLLLQLGLQCCLLNPESRPPMRVVQQAIMQLAGSSPGEDTMTIFSSMPPLPSSMPVYGFDPQVPEPSIEATNREDSSVQRIDTMSILQRRL